MRNTFLRRFVATFLYLCAVLAVSAGVWRYAYLQALEQLTLQGTADLALASDRLVGQLERYRELSVLLADHPVVVSVSERDMRDKARALFLAVADMTGAMNIMFVDLAGRVTMAVGNDPGVDMRELDYVKRAKQGALGWGHGTDAPLATRAFYHAAPVFDRAGRVSGTVIVAAGISEIEDEWRGGFRPVFFTDTRGEVFITNRSELVGWKRPEGEPGLIPANGEDPAFASYRTGGHEVWQMGWGPYLPPNALHIAQDLPIIGLMGETLVDVAPARRLALLQSAAVAALCLAFGAMLFLATERRRALAQDKAELEARVTQRTEALSKTNAALRSEIAEREQAQAALARAQSDLVQAGKLSALGQMSAGISHELNQPLMAIRSFAENAIKFLERDRPDQVAGNLERISDMARRMGRIIQNLRAFSKQQVEPMAKVDLICVLDYALEMIETRAAQMNVEISYDAPDGPVWVQGGEVRLGQVFGNLLQNALDAMSESAERRLRISVLVGNSVSVEIRDTGQGVCEPEKVFEPFYSTKEVGTSEGMGLGLSISYGITKSFGGDIRMQNCAPGALFIVDLLHWKAEKAA